VFLFSEFSKWIGETGLTQKEMVKRLGVSRSFLNSVMVGKSEPNTQFLDKVHQVANEGLGYLKWNFYDPGTVAEHQVLGPKMSIRQVLRGLFGRITSAQNEKRAQDHAHATEKIRGLVESVIEGSLLAFMRNLERSPDQKEEILKEQQLFLAEQITNMFRFVAGEKPESIRFEEVFPPERTQDLFREQVYVTPETKNACTPEWS